MDVEGIICYATSGAVYLLPTVIDAFPKMIKPAVSYFSTTSRTFSRNAWLGPARMKEAYDIDQLAGWSPPQPLPRLEGRYSAWEVALVEAQKTLSLGEDQSELACQRRAGGETWRSQIRSWPSFDINDLEDDEEKLKRAHLVLAWLVNFYVHSLPPNHTSEPIHVPASLAVPLVAVSERLGMAPVLTYSDTVVWNWDLIDDTKPLSIDNVHFQNIFSGLEAERNFYYASLQVELRGVEILHIIDEYSSIRNLDDFSSICRAAGCLRRLKSVVDDMSDMIQSIRSICDPHEFYWDVRPWFEGADSKGPAGPGWHYDGVATSASLDLSGPSAGQSAIIHALDIFLDIDHRLKQKRAPTPSADNRKADLGFMDRMRRYMPAKTREYLEYLSDTPRPVRQLAQSHAALREPYDSAVSALKRLRDLHIRIVCLYVVTQSKSIPNAKSGCPAAAMLKRLQEERAATGPTRGTGGTSLSMLLKAGRDATARALL